MDWRDRYVLIAISLLSGLIGGLLAGVVVMKKLIALQGSEKTPKVITSESYQLLDRHGRLRAAMMPVSDEETVLALFDKDGKPIAMLGSSEWTAGKGR